MSRRMSFLATTDFGKHDSGQPERRGDSSMSAQRLLMSVAVLCCVAAGGVAQAGSAVAATLPDGRVYEEVTPPLVGQEIEAYQPVEPLSRNTKGGLAYQFGNTETEFLFQAAASGDSVAFIGSPTTHGSEVSGFDGGNEYLATRSSSGGWTVSNISPASSPSAVFEAFSSDLSTGFLDSIEPLSNAAPGFGETFTFGGNLDVLYSTATAGEEYAPLFTVRPPYRTRQSFRTEGTFFRPAFSGGSGGGRANNNRVLVFAGASADSTRTLFLANDALTGASEGRPAAEGGPASTYEEENNLYESFDGQLRLVNVLPDGTTHVDATFGGGAPFSRVISSDGARVFWTDLTTGHLYMREDATKTVEISAAGTYQTATSDGSTVFYTSGDLYEYEVESGATTDLTPGVEVERVLGASEDGQYVYYQTTGGEFKLWHEGVTSTIATGQVSRAQVTPDGRSVVFTMQSGVEYTSTTSGHRIEVYDSGTGDLYCASCTAQGTGGSLVYTNEENVYQARWITADGARVFFESFQALVPQDTNGEPDVYEWERPGAGSCTESGGCVYLLSGGTSVTSSHFVDASESGDDVFFVTRAQLLASDRNELFDLYDAKVDGYQPLAPPACSGSGCQGVPGAPPIFATPASVTFEGVGNFEAPSHKSSKKKQTKKKKKRKKNEKKNHHSATNRKKANRSKRRAAGQKRSAAKGGRR